MSFLRIVVTKVLDLLLLIAGEVIATTSDGHICASSSAGFSWFKRMQKAEDFENFVVFGQMNFEDFVFFCRKNFEERKQITIFAQEK